MKKTLELPTDLCKISFNYFTIVVANNILFGFSRPRVGIFTVAILPNSRLTFRVFSSSITIHIIEKLQTLQNNGRAVRASTIIITKVVPIRTLYTLLQRFHWGKVPEKRGPSAAVAAATSSLSKR